MALTGAVPFWNRLAGTVLLLSIPVYGVRQFNLYPRFYIEDLCVSNQSVIYVMDKEGLHSSLWIGASRFPFLHGGRNCTIILQPPDSHGVILSVISMAFGYRAVDGCTDSLKVTFEKTSKQLCGHFRPGDAQSFISDSDMNLLYHTSKADIFLRGTGFTVIATVHSREKTCGDGRFKCNNSKCIWENFACDGINNCGDMSDEDWNGVSQCDDIPNFTVRPIDFDWPVTHPTFSFNSEQRRVTTMTTAVVCLLFIFMTIMLRAYCYRWNLRNDRAYRRPFAELSHTTSSHEINTMDRPPPPYDTISNDCSQLYPDAINANPPPYSVVVLAEEPKGTKDSSESCPAQDTMPRPYDESTSHGKKLESNMIP